MRLRLLLVAVMVAGVAACTPTVYTGPGEGRKVAVVGDSITAYAEPDLNAALSAYTYTVEAKPGINLPDGYRTLVVPVAASSPDVVVVELGINSALYGWTSDHARFIDKTMQALPDACVVWVTPTALSPSYYDHNGVGKLADRIAEMRRSVLRRVPTYDNLHVADFGAVELANPGWYEADHLHLLPAGRKAYAAFVAESVRTFCPT
jgi:lysophospholipase L1-like esterase